MDIYHAWCDLKPGVSDIAFSEGVTRYLGHLKTEGLIEGWRLTRRKLGFGAPGLGEFHLMIEVRDLASSRRRSSAWPGGASPSRASTSASTRSCGTPSSPSTATSLIPSAIAARRSSSDATQAAVRVSTVSVAPLGVRSRGVVVHL